MRPTHGLNFLASYTLGHAIDHVSGLNIGGEPRPVLPVDDRRRGRDRRGAGAREGRRAVRRAPPLRRQLRRRAADARRHGRRRASTSLGGWQLNGIFQAQTGFPLTVTEPSTLDIRYLTNRPDVTCDPERRRAARPSTSGSTPSCFARRTLARDRRPAGNAGRNTVRGPGLRAHRPVALQELRLAGDSSGSSCASRRSTCSTRRASASPAARSARRPSARSPRRRRADRAARGSSTVSRDGHGLRALGNTRHT